MRRVSSKLTSKYQITLPKTIRNYLNIEDSDIIDFIMDDDGKVYIEKGKPKEVCPICNSGYFFSEHCIVCKGEGFIETITKEVLMSTLFNAALQNNAKISLDIRRDIYYIKLETNNELLVLYRDKIQLEIIKMTLSGFLRNNNDVPDYSYTENFLEDQCTKRDLKSWYIDNFSEGVEK